MPQTPSMDQVFLHRLTEIIEANLHDEKFGVTELSRAMGMSRSGIHRKIKVITNKPLNQLIREYRLHKAIEMLRNQEATVAEIAYRVGFGSPAYFTKCFHDYYGYPPGEVKKKVISADGEAIEPDEVSGVELKRSWDDLNETPVSGIKLSRNMVILLSVVAIIICTLAWFLYNHFITGQNHFVASDLKEKDLSIVVLPFKNLSDDPNNQYFADGIMEDILNHLYRISDLRVISRTTSEHFRGTSLTVQEIARKVNPAIYLKAACDGMAIKSRISVQLIDANRDQHLWSANFDRELTDLIGVQGDIALQVAHKLKAIISDNEIRQIEEIPTQNHQAYDFYLKGRFLLNKANNEQRVDISREGLMSSIQYFEKAVAFDRILHRHMPVWPHPGSMYQHGAGISLIMKESGKQKNSV